MNISMSYELEQFCRERTGPCNLQLYVDGVPLWSNGFFEINKIGLLIGIRRLSGFVLYYE